MGNICEDFFHTLLSPLQFYIHLGGKCLHSISVEAKSVCLCTQMSLKAIVFYKSEIYYYQQKHPAFAFSLKKKGSQKVYK